MILAGIVCFNPDILGLKKNIDAISPQVDKILIVDNNSINIDSIKKISDSIEIIELKENKGIAYALRTIANFAEKGQYEWFLTLDQDTVVFEDIIYNYSKYFNKDHAGILTCNYLNRGDNKLITSDWNKNDASYSIAKFCITSASLINTNCYKETPGFDSKMFIDLVDYDLNFSMSKKGYYTYWINFLGFSHEVGNSNVHSFFGKKVSTLNHKPFRRYYLARNAIYLLKKHGMTKETIRLFLGNQKILMKIILFEDNKKESLKEFFRGEKDGLLWHVQKNQY
ncbi:glycosyltransferase [Lactococcus lactis]|uniref:glycosyltransferase n=1 Tax=Lactococcus lactis TaxID=1358 RepID=UPI0028919169|nr:glycosyltransferase [Lactococcus lactis]MDT2926296.1 glycosyltransferase [Lactococcus lactis]